MESNMRRRTPAGEAHWEARVVAYRSRRRGLLRLRLRLELVVLNLHARLPPGPDVDAAASRCFHPPAEA